MSTGSFIGFLVYCGLHIRSLSLAITDRRPVVQHPLPQREPRGALSRSHQPACKGSRKGAVALRAHHHSRMRRSANQLEWHKTSDSRTRRKMRSASSHSRSTSGLPNEASERANTAREPRRERDSGHPVTQTSRIACGDGGGRSPPGFSAAAPGRARRCNYKA